MTTKQSLRCGKGTFRLTKLARFMRQVRLLSTGALLAQTAIVMDVHAAPTGGEIVGGSGSISQTGSSTVIQQNSGSLAINWQSFNLSDTDKVQFVQPSASAAALNRILDQNPSQINGLIVSNGRVFLINANGIIFGKTAIVNVGSLVASSLDLSVKDFMAGHYDLAAIEGAKGAVVNRGIIEAASGGSITLVGQSVSNEGVVVADLGQVNLGAGSKATLDFDGDGLIRFQITGQLQDNATGAADAVRNSGVIQANGGQVLMTANAAADVFTNVVNNEGVIRANRIDNQGGVVRLVGTGGTTVTSGEIDVSGTDAQSTGGEVQVLGDRVGVIGSATIDASGAAGGGTVLVGGDLHGANPEVQNSSYTYVGTGTSIKADARDTGNGGKVVVWSDGATHDYGSVSARGGATGGDGGTVEVSGKQYLDMKGTVDTRAPAGNTGTLLLDPTDITIMNGSGDGAADGTATFAGTPSGTTGTVTGADSGPSTIYESELEGLASTTSIDLQATNNITINDLTDNNLNLATASPNTVTFTADSDNSGAGAFTMNTGDTITTAGADVSINGATVSVGSINAGTGNITLNAGSDLTMSGTYTGTTGSFNAGQGGAGGTLDLGAATLAMTTVSYTGGAGTDTLVGPNATNAWNIGSADGGDLNGNAFTSFENLTGGSGADTFTIASGATLSGSIDGAGGSDTLAQTDGTNAWTVDSANGGTVTDVTGGYSNIENLTGGSGDDTFTFGASGSLSGTIDGGAGTNDAVDYSALASASVALGTDVTNVETLTGGGTGFTLSNGSSWTISGADSGTVDGMTFTDWANLTGTTGADTFTIGTTGSVSGDIDGAGGSDTLAQTDGANAWTIDSANGGTVTGVGGTYSNIENLTGGSGDDTFTFGASGSLAGAIDGGAGTNDAVDYSALASASVALGTDVTNVETLTGGGSGFTLSNGSSWSISGADSGTVDGMTFTDWANLTGTTGADTFTIGSAGSVSGDIDGAGGSDTLAHTDGTNAWTIDGADTGTVTGVGGTYSNIENLTGGSGADTFTIASGATLSGTIDGAGGTDTLAQTDGTNAWTVDSANGGTVTDVTGGYSNIENLTGGSGADTFTIGSSGSLSGTISGGGGSDTLAQTDGTNTWTIDSANGGTVTDVTGGYSSIENLTGGSGADTFTIGNSGSLSGNVDGAGGTDTLALTNGTNAWTIDSANGGTAANVGGTYSNIENLTGGSGKDTFTFGSGGSLSGTIDGGAGTNDAADYSALASANVALGTGVTNVETLTGGGAGFTLSNGSNWTISSANSGTVDGVTFTGWANLTGSSGADIFTINGGSLSGSIDGAGGSDTLRHTGGVTWTIDAANSGTVTDVGGTYSNIENLTGGNGADTFTIGSAGSLSGNINGLGGTDTLVQTDGTNTWTIDSADSGTVTDVGGTYSNIENLTGGSGADTFTYGAAGTLSGTIDGGAGTDTVDYSGLASASVALGSAGVTNVESLTGGGAGFTLSNGSNWTISGANSGTVDGTTFTDWANLTGTSGADTFTIGSAGSVSGTIDGAGGSDTLAQTDGTNTWTVDSANSGTVTDVTGGYSNIENLTGGSGADTFTIASGATLSGSINGGDGTDTLAQTDGTNTWTIASANGGTVTDVGSFSNIENLTGGSGADTFTIGTSGSLSGNIDGAGGSDTLAQTDGTNTWTVDSANSGTVTDVTGTYSNIENLTGGSGADTFDLAANVTTVSGGGGDDVFNVTATGLTLALNGDAGTDTLNGPDAANTWDITSQDAGTLNSTVAFTTMENLGGGSAVDTFNLGADITGSVSGNDGADVFNVSSGVTGDLLGGAGNDSFNLYTGISGDLSIDGGADQDTVTVKSGQVIASTGDISLTAETITDEAGASLGANSLTINGATAIGSSGNRLDTSVGTLTITASNGDAYINEADAITLAGIDVGSHTFDIVAGGAITQLSGTGINATNLVTSSTGGTILNGDNTVASFSATNAGSGNVELTNTGTLSIPSITNTVGDVTVTNTGTINLGLIDATGHTVELNASGSDGSILSANGNGINIVANTASLSADIPDGRIGADGNNRIVFDVPVTGSISLSAGIGPAYIDTTNLVANLISNVGVDNARQSAAQNAAGQNSTLSLKEIGYVDWSLFSEDLNLFGVVEPGLLLPPDQLEDEQTGKNEVTPDASLLVSTLRGWQLLSGFRQVSLLQDDSLHPKRAF